MIANPAISAGWFPGSDTGYQGVRRVVQDRLSNQGKKQQNNNKNKEGLIFFIGQQDDADPMLFHVNDHRLICCLFEELFYPESSNKTSV